MTLNARRETNYFNWKEFIKKESVNGIVELLWKYSII